jgi:sRNA-binding carbon storage regulator CsrA
MKNKQQLPRIAALPDDAPLPVRMMDDLPGTLSDNTRLVISRQNGQYLTISNGDTTIIVRMVEIRGDRARLAIEAPANWLILRSELESQP